MRTFSAAREVRYPEEQLRRPHWYALRTKPRHEKRTHRLLESAGLESFAAVCEVERAWSDRIGRAGIPLFQGYIFVRIELRRAWEVLRWPGALELVRTSGVPVPVREEEMEAVFRLARGIEASGTMPTEADYLEPGARVRVEEGPFERMEGFLLEHRGRGWVAVRLDALRAARAVRIGRSRLVRLPG